MDWDKLRIFHTVAEVGSFTHAGEALTLSQSAVSRQISALEETMHAPLFHRHARGLILTEQGELLYRATRDISAKLAATSQRISDSKNRPQGPLKITTTVAFGSIWLTPRIREFLDAYPDIDVSLVLSESELDLSMRAADVAIRMRPPTQPDLVQRHLMEMRYRVYAAPEYLKAFGIPKTPQDLDNHRLIIYGEDAKPPVSSLNWLLGEGAGEKTRRPVLKVNSIYGIFRAAQSGLGIAALPDYICRDTSTLVEVLPELEGPSFDSFFVYPDELRNSKRIAVFRDFLLRKIAGEMA
ncbi:LysR family transcriptional regulator [Varunaivibrio sulfuroxidans]|uniref:DNA-binding transcriptional LysR family regulator n=1 Tax=Varunaivibrio sulfuroxidans TaxID=1773489 RepID=A0A4R3JGD3_9PROT|nr:LysR family transcriptional regulator [Varunaivibrio sulfuroxidans]TCS64937.1 DNA-binding transcriptional LysR family regulator [Varunaivibrio sulfuroxidans]WES29771.1 LysR family transcriptional regulator [Varunaivibrio sulfuroxidans]